jgi:hypothetical protein
MMNPVGFSLATVIDQSQPRHEGEVTQFTMDALLSYCQSRMRSLDDQIKRVFEDQSTRSAVASGIQNVLDQVTWATHGGDLKVTSDGAHKIIRAYLDAIDAAGGADSTEGAKLQQALDAFVAKVGKNGDLRNEMAQPDFRTKTLTNASDGATCKDVSAADMKAMTDTLKDMRSDLNNGSELQMVTLQSLMSQRQMAIQLTTNLVQSLGDMTNKVVANIGH